jgi:hypothetical protein
MADYYAIFNMLLSQFVSSRFVVNIWYIQGNILVIRYWSSRSQWPRGLMNELSSVARTLGSWVRIPLKAWLSVCVYSVFRLLCVCRDLTTGSSPFQGVLATVFGSITWKSDHGPTDGCRVITIKGIGNEYMRRTVSCLLLLPTTNVLLERISNFQLLSDVCRSRNQFFIFF